MRIVGPQPIPSTGEDRRFYSTADSSASPNQTVFNVSYDDGKVAVFLNGIRLVRGSDFTCTNSGKGTQITLQGSGIAINDYLEVVGYQGMYSGNALVEDNFVVGTASTGSGGSYTNSTTVFPVSSSTGDLVSVWKNGIKLVPTDFTVNASASTVTLQSASNTADKITVQVVGLIQHSSFVRLDNNGDLTIPDGDLVIGTAGHGISFSNYGSEDTISNTTITSNLLDDYEEGTWTPVIGGHTLSIMTAQYTKIGRNVHLFAQFTTNNTATVSVGNSYIFYGVPFVPDAPAIKGMGGVVQFYDSHGSNQNALGDIVYNNGIDTEIILVQGTFSLNQCNSITINVTYNTLQ